MRKDLKVKAIYKNSIGFPIEVSSRMSSNQILNLINRDDVRLVSVNGIPAEYYIKNINIA